MTQFMDDWRSLVSEILTGKSGTSPDDLKRDCILHILRDDNTVEATVRLVGVWPSIDPRCLNFEKTSLSVTDPVLGRVVERPWGRRQELYRSDLLVVNIIEIAPSHRTALHKHYRRRERCWVISGTGYAEWDGESTVLRHDREYVTAPESIHLFANNGAEPLFLLEVQTGDCHENDVVRYDDEYGRQSQEYLCEPCGSTWDIVGLYHKPAMFESISRGCCPKCGVSPLTLQPVAVPQGQPDRMTNGHGNLWCRACGAAVDDDEGPCPVCEDDLELTVTTEPQDRVFPQPAPIALLPPVVEDEPKPEVSQIAENVPVYARLWRNRYMHSIATFLLNVTRPTGAVHGRG